MYESMYIYFHVYVNIELGKKIEPALFLRLSDNEKNHHHHTPTVCI